MAKRYQNRSDTTDRVPAYYVNNNLYPRAYTHSEIPTRTSRRLHDGLSIDRNYGLDTTSDDLNASPYSSPYYVNGRYNSSNLTTQTGNSASVQGTKRLLSIKDEVVDFTEADIEDTMELWQGKQVKFEIPYTGKVVGTTLTLKNTDNCKGVLSIYFSAKDGGPVLAEAAIDLCAISQDEFQHKTLYLMTPVPARANPHGTLYVRMEIWDEIECKRSANPFNTGRKIEIAATGNSNHYECVYKLGEKNTPAREEYNYVRMPSRPCLGLIYNSWHSVPTNRNEGVDYGATVSKDGYSYDLFCISDGVEAEVLVYDRQANVLVSNNIKVDGRVQALNLIQAADEVFYVDGYSPLQSTKIGEWQTFTYPSAPAEDITATVNLDTWIASGIAKDSGTFRFTYTNGQWEYQDNPVNLATYGISINGIPSPNAYINVSYTAATQTTIASVAATYVDVRPVIAASLILMHHNRIYLAGFLNDPNLVQCSQITHAGPDFSSFPYRFYSPGVSPLSTSTNPITAMVQYQADQLMICTTGGFSIYTSNVNLESGTPTQVSTYSDGAGVAAQGDITNYRGIVYSFDPDEGIRRYTGNLWNAVPATVDTHVARVDMNKPRKLWGYAYKLYFNYTDVIDGKAKCLVWDMDMNYQQYPWFQDTDLPFCDVRTTNDFELIGIHPDFPCIMKLYHTDTWRRLDTPINFERHTKYISLPGNASDMILHQVHNKVIANSNRWWFFALSADTHTNEQERGHDAWYRMPCWATEVVEQPVETPFPSQDIYETDSTALLTLPNLWVHAISVQEKIKCRTFRNQANLVSTLFEAAPKRYI